MFAAILVTIVVVFLLASAFRLWLTAHRLDRLHKRTEAAWAACEEALARRIVAARSLAAAGHLDAERAGSLRRAATDADRAPRGTRDIAEQRLSEVLAGIGAAERGDLAIELADARERVTLACRFYNDAVRDTRALRASWFTRFFRLAGRARLPEFFDMPAHADGGDSVTG